MALSTKDPAETITVEFDFSDLSSTTPSSAVTTAAAYQGTDTTPLVMGTTTISGTKVEQTISGGTAGMIYGLRCVAQVSGNPLVVAGVLAVRSLP